MNPQTNHLSPKERYAATLKANDFKEDAAQAQAIDALQGIYDAILNRKGSRVRRSKPIDGLYMWGGVGRGKTFLMDMFYESLPVSKKQRIHFHRFMQGVHADLAKLKDKTNPLDTVADNIHAKYRTICFDEFFVSDIADAMILGTLFEALFKRGITLVATSNIPPDQLYKNGLQRARFMPAIEQLKQHTTTLNVDGGNDYRLRALEQASIYYTPHTPDVQAQLKKTFEQLSGHEGEAKTIEINSRAIPCLREADGVAWFDFDALCDGPRSQNDYIEIAREYHSVVLSNVPALDGFKENQARRFINLVDEFYDRHVKLVISAAKPINELYSGKRVVFEFDRTMSRLLEMQSHDYLGLAHLP